MLCAKLAQCLFQWVMIALLCCSCADRVCADETSSPANISRAVPLPDRFQRVFVPVNDLPRAISGHVPIAIDDLQDMAASLDEESQRQNGNRITKGIYTARFADGYLVDGNAELTIALGDGRSTAIDLGSPRLALQVPAEDEDSSVALGVDDFQRTMLTVPRDGSVRLSWTLASERPAATPIEFSFTPITSPYNELRIDLPHELDLQSSQGLVYRATRADEAGGLVRWRVALGGHPTTQLRVTPASSGTGDREWIIVEQQTTTYRLASQGIGIVSTLDLACSKDNQTVQLRLPTSVQLDRILVGHQEATWHQLGALPTEQNPNLTRIALTLPVTSDRRCQLQILAKTDLVTAQPFELPQLVLDDVLSQRREIELLVPRHMAVGVLTLDQWRWLSQQRDEDTGTRRLRMQALADDATLRVSCTTPTAEVLGRSTTDVTFAPDGMIAVLSAQLTGHSGLTYELVGQLQPAWAIDSVTCEPAAALDDWTIENRLGKRSLRFSFATPLTDNRNVQLTCVARRVRPDVGVTFDGNLASVVAWQGVRWSSVVRSFSATAPLRLDIENDDQVVPLMTEADYAYAADETSHSPRLRLLHGQPPWHAMLEGDMTFGERFCDERWHIVGEAAEGELDSIIVQLSPARQQEVRWFLDQDGNVPATAVRLNAAEQTAENIPNDDEAYRIKIPRSTGKGFAIWAARRRPLKESGDDAAITIATTPQAKSRGAILRVNVEHSRPGRFYVDSQLPSVLATKTADANARLVTALSYDGSADLSPPWLRHERSSDSPSTVTAAAWISRATTSSAISPTGETVHRTQLQIEHHGLTRVLFQLPSNGRLQSLWVNHQPSTAVTNQEWIDIPLVPDSGTTTAVIEYVEPQRRLHVMDTFRQPNWRIDVPVALHTWELSVPRRYTLVGKHVTAPLRWRVWNMLLQDPADGHDQLSLVAPTNEQQRLVIRGYDRSTFHALAFVAFLLCGGLVWGRKSLTPYNGYGLSFSLAVALFAPGPLGMLGAAMFWGTLLGCGLRLVPRPPRERGAAAVLRPIVTTTVALLGCCVMSDPAAAQPAGDKIPVIIPFDETKQTPSGFAYVAKAAYEQLVRTSQLNRRTTLEWLIERVHYHVTFSTPATNEPVEAQAVDAHFDIQTMRPGTAISLRLGVAARERWSGQARLDGSPVSCRWDEPGEVLEFAVEAAGAHRLQLRFQPSKGNYGDARGIDLPIVPHPSSALTIEAAALAGLRIEIPSAQGALTKSPDGTQLHAQLGPADSLAVRWREQSETQPSKLQQLMHVTISPGLMWMRVSAIDSTSDQSPDRLSMRIPEGAIVRTGQDAAVLIRRRRGQIIDVTWPDEYDAERFVELMMPTDYVGDQLTAPLPQLVDAETEARWLFVQTDDSLCIVHDETTVPDNAAQLSALGMQNPLRSVVQRIPIEQQSWSVTAPRRSTRLIADEQTDIHFEMQSTHVDYRADIVPVEGRTFQLNINIPDNLEVVASTVKQDGEEQPVSWVRAARGLVRLLPSAPVVGPYQLRLEGRLPVQHREPQPLPMVHLADVQVNRAHFQVTRSSSVGVQLADVKGMSRQAEVPTGFRASSGRAPVADLEMGDEQNPAARVTTWPNTPTLKGDIVTTVRALENKWSLQADVVVTSEEGFVDAVTFELPASMGDNIQVSPTAPWEVIALPGGRRRLRIRTPIKTGEQTRLILTAGLDTTEGIVVPRVAPLGFSELRSWILLPNSVDERELNWLTRRMVPQRLPNELDVGPTPTHTSYRAIGRRSSAELRPSPDPSQASIELCQHHVQLNGNCLFQRLKYYVQPSGQSKLAFRLPPSMELISATAAGRRSELSRVDPSTAEMIGLPTTLPFVVELVGRRGIRNNQRELQIDWPYVIDCESKQTIHYVSSQQYDFALAHPASSFVPATESVAKESQLGVLEALENLPASVTSAASPAELASWRLAWQQISSSEDNVQSAAPSRRSAVFLSRPERDVSVLPIRFERGGKKRFGYAAALVAIMLPAWCGRHAACQRLLSHMVRWLPGMLAAALIFAAIRLVFW